MCYLLILLFDAALLWYLLILRRISVSRKNIFYGKPILYGILNDIYVIQFKLRRIDKHFYGLLFKNKLSIHFVKNLMQYRLKNDNFMPLLIKENIL